MSRPGTLIDGIGRPIAEVTIIRRGKTTTLVECQENFGELPQRRRIRTTQVLDDGGCAWRAHAARPHLSSLTDLNKTRTSIALIRVIRTWTRVAHVQIYQGDGEWSGKETVDTKRILWDGGKAHGFNPPTF